MASDSAAETSPPEERQTLSQKILHEIRETALTIAIFLPFWLVFTTFIYELRSIPTESMVPALQVGDRVAVAKFAYGYNRNSVPFGIGKPFIGASKDNPSSGLFVRPPKRGDVVVFQHPHYGRVMIKRLIGLPGDRIQIRDGRLFLNEEEVGREEVRKVTYIQDDSGVMVTATEYREQLPGEDKPHLIHEMTDTGSLDSTPIFRVPEGHVFMMGDNRDNSLDSRAPTGHLELAKIATEGWAYDPPFGIRQGWTPPAKDMAIGFVPMNLLIGRADTVLFTLHRCRKADGAECAKGRVWQGL
jgi:signal peptidase I